eukprot:537440-Pleurochrysis_carterae.AAC.1
MLCRDSAEPGPAPAENPLTARLAWLESGTMADPHHSGPPPCLLRGRSCARVCLGGCVGVRHGREVETGVSVFALVVDLVSVGRVDSVDQGEVDADAVDALRVVFASVFDAFYLLLVLEDFVGQGSWPSRVAVAWTARIHLVMCEMAGALRAPLPVWPFVRRSASRGSSLR